MSVRRGERSSCWLRRMKSDMAFNIRFVQLVEKYPQLYNYNIPDYSNKAEIEKAWTEIAKEVQESREGCIEKWRILRGGMSRFLKQNSSGNSTKKDYYLAKYMQFVVPYLRTRSQRLTLQPVMIDISQTEGNSSSGFANAVDEHEVSVPVREEEHGASIEPPSCQREPSTSQKRKSSDRFYSAFTDYVEMKKTCKRDINENPDMLFFRSVLPMVDMLDNRRKIEFRVNVLNVLNELLYSRSSPAFVNSEPTIYTTNESSHQKFE
ncbi:hypothetical protein C0J52_18361 [Blattella germanica]|nr:hypothetical protein C0J52_18361 [Blattella germanica]